MNTFQIKEEDFLLNGKKFQILSGAIHYFRIPSQYWEDSLYNLKAMGFNTVETYIPWNIHEPYEGVFDFKGNKNISDFVTKAQEMGLWVILRPSPFICAEWEFGGLPAWLLRYPDLKVRTNTPLFISKVDTYYKQLFKQIDNLQITKGGPVLMMQVENEYGSFGNDNTYLKKIRDLMIKYGATVPLFTADGSWEEALESGSLVEDNILPTGNFGSHSNENLDTMLHFFKKKNKKFPLMCMEFWDGWFNRWGEDIITRDAQDLAEDVKELLKRASINLYMFQGGTNFGFYNGCSARGERDLPQITSYNYDAILTEWGEPTEKFYKIQKVVQELFPDVKTFPPRDRKRDAYKDAKLTGKTSLFFCKEDICSITESVHTLTMEEAGSGYGYILYTTKVKGRGQEQKVKVIQASDRVKFYLNGNYQETQYCEQIGQEILMPFKQGENELQILVENLGRVNYGYKLLSPTQKKGIRSGVMTDIHFESDWKQYAFDLSNINKVPFDRQWQKETPSFYRYEFEAEDIFDTFLDCRNLGKGVIFINGINLGRYWKEGPCVYLFVPGAFLKKGINELIVFETEGNYTETLSFSDKPIYFEKKTKLKY